MTTASSMPLTKPSSQPTTPCPPDSVAGRHLIYRGLAKSSMEYMSLAHSNKPEAAHTLKGEILISGRDCPGYIQYCITLDQDWMTRRVMLTATFEGSQEKRVVLEVTQDRRWYKVTEPRLVRSRSFFRSGIDSPARTAATASSSPRLAGRTPRDSRLPDNKSSNLSRTSSESMESRTSMQDADASFSDDSSCCSSSSFSSLSSDEVDESSVMFEKINLTWSPPAKGSKRGSKRFSSFNPLKDVLTSAAPPTPTTAPAASN
ncbi:hypothetical protein BGZ98_003489 [Dissophora globulifera]|nr:hypothetical protein BGZ98_003489 [Dissophora globulifera]